MLRCARRAVMGAVCMVLAATTLHAQNNENRFATIDRQVDSAIGYMLVNVPETEDLMERSVGMLMIPVITKGGFALGGSYGEGALRINGETAGFYSAVQVNFGLQFGVKQYSHALFFMNEGVLDNFRNKGGWKLGADSEAVVVTEGDHQSISSLDNLVEVVGVVFGQSGIHIGLSLEGTAYSEIEP